MRRQAELFLGKHVQSFSLVFVVILFNCNPVQLGPGPATFYALDLQPPHLTSISVVRHRLINSCLTPSNRCNSSARRQFASVNPSVFSCKTLHNLKCKAIPPCLPDFPALSSNTPNPPICLHHDSWIEISHLPLLTAK
jgi:hypothetical protein